MSISIRQLTNNDLEIADKVLRSGFQMTTSRKEELLRYLVLQPDGWFMAELDSKPVGMVGAVDYGTFAHIGLMAVHQSVQRRGIGRALMDHLLAWIDGRGTPITLLDATESGAMLYPQLGFFEEGATSAYQCDAPFQLAVVTAADRVRLLNKQDIPAVVAFDTPIFGANRERVFAQLLKEYPDRAFVRLNVQEQVTGFLFTTPKRIGPFNAATPQGAEALLAATQKLTFEYPISCIIPAENIAARELLIRCDFFEVRTIRHMRRGGLHHPGQYARMYAKTSFAIG